MDDVLALLLKVFQQQINNPVTILLINLGAYLLAEKLFIRMGRKGWLHPLFTTSLFIYLFIRYTSLDVDYYLNTSEILKILLAPFTVALAIPLSRQMHHLRNLVGPLLCTLMIGGFLAVILGVGAAMITGGSTEVVLSISTKAVTTAVALVIGERYGAIIPLVAAVVIVSGVYGSLIGPTLCRWIGITDARVIGFTMGINAHAGGTARSFELDMTMGVYASLGMCLSAIYMPLLLPVIVLWII